jgi:hypothetical protein
VSHADARAKERLGIALRPHHLLRIIKAGQAKLVAFGEQERLIYDVPSEGTTVRVVVNKELDWVVSVLPAQFKREREMEKIRSRHKTSRRVRQEFFSGFEGDEDDCQTSES